MSEKEVNKWNNPDFDLLESFRRKEWEHIREYVQNNKILSWSELNENNPDESLRIMEFENSLLKEFIDDLLGDDELYKIVFEIGNLQGCVQTVAKLLSDKLKEDYVSEQIDKCYSSIKNLDLIIEQIDMKGGLTHTELGHRTEIKLSTLTECMKKILKTNLVESRRSGKCKIYFLTEYGMKYAKKLRREKEKLNLNIHNKYNAIYETNDIFEIEIYNKNSNAKLESKYNIGEWFGNIAIGRPQYNNYSDYAIYPLTNMDNSFFSGESLDEVSMKLKQTRSDGVKRMENKYDYC
ncbi:MAG: hypothetical protein K6G26_09320 [Lachnospiraceae bacterium]|nr:hypothetical protein [Lachnospiraceae bacterium]